MNEDDTDPTSTSWASMRVMLAPGDLLVAREGLALIVADPRTPGQDATVDRLLELCADAGRAVAEGTAEALVRSTAALLATADAADVPPLGMVTVDSDRLLVTLTRGIRMSATGADGAVASVDADDSLLPVNRVLPAGATHVVLGPDPATLRADRRSNLSGGVVRAGGLLLVPGTSAASDEHRGETLVDLAPVTPEPPPPTFTTFSLHEETEAESEVPAPEVDTAVPAGPMVRGIVCSRGHFNAPLARFCGHCGIAMVHQTHNVVTGERPPLGVLIVDDGAVHALVRDYVIGRDPDSADEVRSGRASALMLDDPDLSMSRVHARLVLDGWEVRVEDAGSVNGTFVSDPGSEEWRQLDEHVPATITPGSRLRMGARVITYESHHKA